MGRAELAAIESGSTGEASGDMFFRLGMMYSIGADMPTDYVTAHKWFNLAAMRGVDAAKGWRNQMAAEMNPSQIAQAQKLAREWLRVLAPA